ncbi:hypothetical protein ACIBF5_06705 [Micromonospora sp. NPDC050417]|uniref:hypothetical protein n=1 Tax=Micromonospora sp. NPDC050417 TaxID=3364280 RepID=UPI0037B3CAC9
MLASVEIRTVLAMADSPVHNLHWQPKLALSMDCFTCERTGRTTWLTVGAERAVCTGDGRDGQHYSAARIATFDHTDERHQTSLRVVVDYWWAPFHDAKRDIAAAVLTRTPWVRHYLGYRCPQQEESGEFSIKTNLNRPVSQTCQHCSASLCESRDAPQVRLLMDPR